VVSVKAAKCGRAPAAAASAAAAASELVEPFCQIGVDAGVCDTVGLDAMAGCDYADTDL